MTVSTGEVTASAEIEKLEESYFCYRNFER